MFRSACALWEEIQAELIRGWPIKLALATCRTCVMRKPTGGLAAHDSGRTDGDTLVLWLGVRAIIDSSTLTDRQNRYTTNVAMWNGMVKQTWKV